MKRTINITDGAAFKYSYLGLIGVIISILLIVVSDVQLIGIITLPISVFIFLSIRGSIIDIEGKRFKHYWIFVFIKLGKWETLNKFS